VLSTLSLLVGEVVVAVHNQPLVAEVVAQVGLEQALVFL
jgi:hypothetical protein